MLQKLTKVIIASIFLILIISFTAGCTQQTSSSTEVTASGGLGIKTDVEIKNFKFNPETVTIPAGTTVIWTNNDSTNHTVVSTTGNEMDSGSLNPGDTFAHMFNVSGTYEYHCSIHTTMGGKVVVEPSTLQNNQK